MNGVQIATQGHIANDPEKRYTSSGKALLNFSLGVTENRSGSDGAETTWLRITCWEEDAERLAEILKRGQECYIEGKLTHREWTGRDGEPKCGLSVSAWTVTLLGAIGRRAPKRERADDERATEWVGVPKTAEVQARSQ